MAIGSFDKRVTIQTRSGQRDAMGNVQPVWSSIAQRWCRIEDQAGRELNRAQKVDPTISAVVTMREKYAGLSPKDRLTFADPNGTRTFSIKAVLGASDRTPKQGQALACLEEVDDG